MEEDSLKVSNALSKLHYDTKHKDDMPTVSEFTSPSKPTRYRFAPDKKKVRHSFGCPRDTDWQRRMDGFEGIGLDPVGHHSGKVDKQKYKSSSRRFTLSSMMQSADSQTPESQQRIDDWGSSDEDRKTPPPPLNKQSVRGEKSNVAGVCRYTNSPESTITIDDLDSPAAKRAQNFKKKEPISSSRESNGPITSIASFESEDEKMLEDVQENDEESEESPAIASSKSQSPEPSLSLSSANKPKASMWLKSLQSTSPEKTEPENVEDSAKKKKPRYVKEGFAESLQRQIQHEKSSFTFWTHKMKNSNNQDIDTSKILSLHLTKFEKTYSLVQAHAIIEHIPSKDQIEKEGEVIIALFTEAVWSQKQLSTGVSVVIHPPWQMLRQQTGEKILLGTNLCQVIRRPKPLAIRSHRDDDQSCHTTCSFGEQTPAGRNERKELIDCDEIVIAQWSCPCSKDSSLLEEDCPAHTNPVQSFQSLVNTEHSNSSPIGLKFVSQSQQTHTRMPHSMLQAIEQCRGGSISFVATIQRIFKKRTITNDHMPSKVYSLLLQDSSGFVCQLMLPPGAQNSKEWHDLLAGGQGVLCEFSGLRVLQRLHRNKSPRLFSMIDSVWRSEAVSDKTLASQDSSQQSDAVPNRQPSSFCYVFQVPPGESCCKPLTKESSMPTVYTAATYSTVADILTAADSEAHRRMSINGYVVHRKDQVNDEEAQKVLMHVVNKSDNAGCVTLNLLESFPLDECLQSNFSCFNFNDILVHNGMCSIDEFSEIVPITTSDDRLTTENIIKKIPLLSQTTRVGDLCAIQGHVCGVEEETAFSWLVCPRCKADELQGGTTKQPFLFCITCKKGVSEPVTMMDLEVYIKSSTLPHSSIKVKLLQDTIERLLPSEAGDEGYDMQCVLNKPIGLIFGEVLHISSLQRTSSISLQEVIYKESS